ncbi:biotin synthase BioB [Mycetohabitans rhizoxinica]|uniref:Biotin synthase n=1 Tax=Mycetohabitans rhizoxinica TaxID=412963 RepID=A0ABZ2Q781_9BURK
MAENYTPLVNLLTESDNRRCLIRTPWETGPCASIRAHSSGFDKNGDRPMTVIPSAAHTGLPASIARGGSDTRALADISTAEVERSITTDITRDQHPMRWSTYDIAALYELPLGDLLLRAQQTHRDHFDPNAIELSTQLSIRNTGCEEDCVRCPSSAHHGTELKAAPLVSLHEVLSAARAAKESGASRFYMSAAWRNLKPRHLDKILEMIRGVKALGLETCATLGMLDDEQAKALHDAGLDYYNHNLDTSPEFYGQIISTRTYQDRLDTLERVRNAGIAVCCGGIIGLGESRRDRAGLIAQLANMAPYPESVPINGLMRVEGTPQVDATALDPFEFVRTIAIARMTMPTAVIRLSAGREHMNDALQALCFFAGANAVLYSDPFMEPDHLLRVKDRALFTRLGLHIA